MTQSTTIFPFLLNVFCAELMWSLWSVKWKPAFVPKMILYFVSNYKLLTVVTTSMCLGHRDVQAIFLV